MVGSHKNIVWGIVIGITCLFVGVSLSSKFRHKGHSKSASSFAKASPSPSVTENTDSRQETALIEDPSPSPVPGKGLASPSPAVDQKFLEARQKMLPSLNSELREEAKGLYGAVFQQLHLSGDVQEKVIDILTQQEKRLEQQAFDAAKLGTVPTPPSAEELRTQQAQQDQQLRSVLGDAGLTEFNQYQSTIPDRMIVNAMNQQDANLSDDQTQQLLQILKEERNQIFGQASINQSLASMPPDQAMATIQQQELLLQQAVNNRIQNLLTPEQRTTLQGVFSQYSVHPQNQ